MKHPLTLAVSACLLGDLCYGILTNTRSALQNGAFSPQAVLSWLPVLANAAMLLILAFGLRILWHYQNANRHSLLLQPTPARLCGLMAAAAFAFPALPLWLHALLMWAKGHNTVNTDNLFYTAVSLAQILLLFLCLNAVRRQTVLYYRLRRPPANPPTVYLPPE